MTIKAFLAVMTIIALTYQSDYYFMFENMFCDVIQYRRNSDTILEAIHKHGAPSVSVAICWKKGKYTDNFVP